MARHSEVNFRLKPKDSSGQSLIYLQFLFNKQRLFFSFNQKIDPANWNNNKQRVKRNNTTTWDGKHLLNDLLDNLERECHTAYNTFLKHGIPTPGQIKEQLKAFINQNTDSNKGEDFYSLGERFCNNEIRYKGRQKTRNTVKGYKTLIGHLKEFETVKKYPISFETINLDFYNKFVDYLAKRSDFERLVKQVRKELKDRPVISLDINSIGKDVKNLKVIMSEAVDLGYTSNMAWKHKKFVVPTQETDAVYLTDREILSIYRHDFSHDDRLGRVRDLFVFGCFVGLRFSDLSDVRPENIIQMDEEYFIKIQTKKTGEVVIIPCNPVVLQIFDKYSANSNKLPRSVSNQKFNSYIKEVLQEAGLTETGRLISDPNKHLFECVSSHTARRSFATNLYLAGFPTLDIMKITGHKTETAFMRYIKTSKIDAAKRLSEHIKMKWSEKLLKAI